MTPRMAETLNAIRKLTVDVVSPTYSELSSELGGLSRSAVHRSVKALADRGYVTQEPNISRSIKIIDQSLTTCEAIIHLQALGYKITKE